MNFSSLGRGLVPKSLVIAAALSLLHCPPLLAAKHGSRKNPQVKPVTIVVANAAKLTVSTVEDSKSPSDVPVNGPSRADNSDVTPSANSAETSSIASELESAKPSSRESAANDEASNEAITPEKKDDTGHSSTSNSEHDAHQPLQLPPLGNPPSVDLQKDPIYQELMKTLLSNQKLSLVGETVESDPSVNNAELPSDAYYYAAEKMFKIARKLQKEEKRLREEDDEEGAERTRENIRNIRQVAMDLLFSAAD